MCRCFSSTSQLSDSVFPKLSELEESREFAFSVFSSFNVNQSFKNEDER